MDVLDRYINYLTATARQFVEQDRSAVDIMRRDMETTAVPELVALRVQFLSPQDHERVGGLLASGCFSEMDEDERLAAFVVCFELDDEISKLDVARRFQRYAQEQPLFLQCPSLWPSVRDTELIATAAARHLRRSGPVEVPDGWGRLDPFLPPELLQWVEATFSEAALFVRLDPWFASANQPIEPLREAAVRPARPGWWSNLDLRNREADGGHYILQPSERPCPERVDEFWDYHVRGVRSLEVHADRDKGGRLSMMIEELAEEGRPDSRLFGRCIHLDTFAPGGTEAGLAPVKHLDLAINVYFGESAARRRAMKLCDGMVVDASVRTHLLRIEGVPFASSAEFARQFFQSKVLLSEWMQDQFGGSLPPFDGE